MPKPDAARNAQIAAALEATALGTPLADIAAALGLELPALRQWALSKATADNYPEIAELYHHARIIEADRALDRAKDHAEIGKRTQQAKLARFDAERRLSRLWGPKQELAITDDRPPPDLLEVARRVAYIQHMASLSGVKVGLPAAARQPIDVTPLPPPVLPGSEPAPQRLQPVPQAACNSLSGEERQKEAVPVETSSTAFPPSHPSESAIDPAPGEGKRPEVA